MIHLKRGHWYNHLFLISKEFDFFPEEKSLMTLNLWSTSREISKFPTEYFQKGIICTKNQGTISINTTDRLTDHRPMLFVHSRMVRRPVGRSVMLIETAPSISNRSWNWGQESCCHLQSFETSIMCKNKYRNYKLCTGTNLHIIEAKNSLCEHNKIKVNLKHSSPKENRSAEETRNICHNKCTIWMLL